MHQKFSPECWRSEKTLTPCLGVGLGPRGFDCSGLVIRAMCDMYGVSPEAWPPELRHTRQIWRAVLETGDAQPPHAAEPGDIIVYDRLWTMPDGSDKYVPAHIAIQAREGNTLQAQARVREVICRPPRRTSGNGGRIGSFTLQTLDAVVQRTARTGTLDDGVLKALS